LSFSLLVLVLFVLLHVSLLSIASLPGQS
jgi:hypothetical protein